MSQDAHEFFGEVIDMVNEEIDEQRKKNGSSKDAEINPTVDNFEFEVIV